MKIIGILLLAAGIYLLVMGFSRRDSLVGHADSAADRVANSVDGGSRQPRHVGYIVGGGALLLAGAFLALRGGSGT